LLSYQKTSIKSRENPFTFIKNTNMKFSTSLFIAITALCLSTAFAAPAGHGIHARSFESMQKSVQTGLKQVQTEIAKGAKKVQSSEQFNEIKKLAAKAKTDMTNTGLMRRSPLTLEEIKKKAIDRVEKAKSDATKAMNNSEIQGFIAKAKKDFTNL
jgi:hypothetical protein